MTLECPLCGAAVSLALVVAEDRDRVVDRRAAWLDVEDDALRREAEGGRP